MRFQFPKVSWQTWRASDAGHASEASVNDYVLRLPAPAVDRGARATADGILRWLNHALVTRHASRDDCVALALACRDRKGRVVCSNSLGALGPGMVDRAELTGRIEAFLDEVRCSHPGEGAQITAALLSLGDMAHSLGTQRIA